MRRLEAVRLVQWYHFQDETFPIGGSCLLLGDNGSGKTTVLDAIQVALVANLSEVLLNRAANERSRRTLLGYVRWKIGSEDESRPGAVRFGRGACTSYVLLEFRDDQDPSLAFTCGIGFEATETDSDLAKAQFVVPGARVSDVEAVVRSGNGQEGDVVRPLRDFRGWVREHGGQVWQDAGTYREELRQRLGVLPESFHRLIVKALAFKPIGQVRQFVFDYLLDPRPIDTDALQLNLDNYKRLEGEAKDAAGRIAELEKIVHEGERIRTEQRTVESHRFMELRADSDAARTKLNTVIEQLAQARARLQGLATKRDALDAELSGLERELDRIVHVLEGHEVFRQIRDLERQIDETKRALEDAEAADHEARKLLRVQTEALDALLSEEARAFRRVRPELFERDDILGAEDAPDVVARLRRTLGSEGALAGRDLATWERRLDRAADRVRHARLLVQMEFDAAKSEGAALQDEQRMLEAGRQRYPDGPAALLHLLATRLKSERREPKPLCELIEAPNTRWRDAVEGYLGGRRFDVIVVPEDYSRALTLFERHKRDYPLPGRGTVFIGGVGLVDIERVLRAGPRCASRSLAEQVETKDPYARAYCDYVLGDVVCVDDEQSLRKHSSAITDTVMVYRNHVARQTPRDVFSRHYIGEAARRRRLEEIATRLGELHERVVLAAGQIEWLGRVVKLLDSARAEVRRLPDLVERAEGVVNFRLQVVRLAETKAKIDRSGIRELEETRDALGKRRAALTIDRDDTIRETGNTEAEIRSGENERGRAEGEARHAEEVLEAFVAPLEAATRETYEQRYVRERAERSPGQIHEIFERQRRGIEKRVDNLVVSFVLRKSRYVDHRGFAGTVEGSDFSEFGTELEVWRDSRLPEYEQKISEAKTKALQQLAEDVVFRLRENLLLVRRQIDELNRALQDVRFGTEGYQFTVEVEPEHRDFYNVVMDAGRYEKESLFGGEGGARGEGDVGRVARPAGGRRRRTSRRSWSGRLSRVLPVRPQDPARDGGTRNDKVSGDKSGGDADAVLHRDPGLDVRAVPSRSRDE